MMANPDRRFYRLQWGLLGEWWCVAEDLTDHEQGEMCSHIRAELGADFLSCPLDYIRDRLFGGFACTNHAARRHVFFSTGSYSFLAAAEACYRENDSRPKTWRTLLEANQDFPGDGPFADDYDIATEVQA